MIKKRWGWFAAVAAGIMTVKNQDICIAAVHKGFEICVGTVIPSLFPFAVISVLMSGLKPPDFISRPVSFLFGISPCAAGAVITGAFAGFPSGAVCCAGMYHRGLIGKEEAERLICYTNNPSLAFFTGAVGEAVFADRSVGFVLWLLCMLYSLITGIILGRTVKPRAVYHEIIAEGTRQVDFAAAVKNAAYAMLTVSAFVIIFSVISAYASAVLPESFVNVKAAVSGFLEIGGAVTALGSFNASPYVRFILAAVFTGWSGLSVHMQIASVCRDDEISMRKYLAVRLISAPVMGALALLSGLFLFQLFGK